MEYIKRIRDLREDSDYTQAYVAEYLGIKRQMYRRYEMGETELPLRHLTALAKLYNCTTDYILGLEK